MNGLKALVAASTLVLAAGSAHSALWTFNSTWIPAVTGSSDTTSSSGSGSGTFDDVTSVLTITGTENLVINFGTPATTDAAVVNRTFTIDTLNLQFTHITHSCDGTATNLICGSAAQALGEVRATGTSLQWRDPNAAVTTGTLWPLGRSLRINEAGVQNRTFVFTDLQAAPAVPVPAAAWLFGSGLLGLAGAARKRRG